MVFRSSGIGAKHGLYHKKIMRKLGFLMISVKISHTRCHQVFWLPTNGLTQRSHVDSCSGLALRCKPKTAYATVHPLNSHWMVPSSSLA